MKTPKPSRYIKRRWRKSGRVMSLQAWARKQVNDRTEHQAVAADWLKHKGVTL